MTRLSEDALVAHKAAMKVWRKMQALQVTLEGDISEETAKMLNEHVAKMAYLCGMLHGLSEGALDIEELMGERK